MLSSRFVAVIVIAAHLAACVARPPAPTPGRGFSFALIGDMPYGAREEALFDRVIDDINADASIAFVLHAGDIKGGGESCADTLLRARLEQLRRLQPALVYTPGDNEWTDCHRGAAGRFDPLERLAALRAMFYSNPHRSLGAKPLVVEPQSAVPGFAELVENVLFVRDGIVFATVHIVGSENNLEPWSGIDTADSRPAPRPDRLADVVRRTEAALQWIDAAFARARTIGAHGVWLLMQANPRFELPASHQERAPFEPIIARLQDQARGFEGTVVLAHGDFHEYVVDKPLPQAKNLTRVQTFGSPRLHWVKITVEPGAAGLFRFAPRHVVASRER